VAELSFTPLDPEVAPFRCDETWAVEIQTKVHDHLEALALEVPEHNAMSDEPYCGCLTCIVRETLLIVIPAVLDGARDGLVERA
jgi:hypothetical protein